MASRNVIIDCDTGVDDAMALLLALRSPAFNVLGITTVAGNALIKKVVRNTLIVVENSGKDVPVYEGAFRPMVGAWKVADYAHGTDGLGDIGFPDPTREAEREHAVDFIVRAVMDATEPVELITLAPLTNIAWALAKEPRLAERIPAIWMMAGAIDIGNTTPAAEFNVWVDPEAADIVYRSAIPQKTMIGLKPIRNDGGIHSEDVAQLEAAKSGNESLPWCWMAGRLLRMRLLRMAEMIGRPVPTTPPDLAAMGVAIDDSIAESTKYHVAIETKGEHTRGMTVVDQRDFRHWRDEAPPENVNVVTGIDNARYRRLVLDTWLA